MDPSALFRQAVAHMQSGRYADAESACRGVLAMHPEQADVLHLLGLVVFQLGRADESETLLRQASSRAAGHPAIAFNLGNVLLSRGKHADAAEAFARAAQLQPDYLAAWLGLGGALAGLSRWPDAENAYRRALSLKADLPPALAGLGGALRMLGRIDEAIDALARAAALAPAMVEAHVNLANALRERGRLPEAIAAFRRALELRPDFAPALSLYGVALAAAGRMDEALANFERAVSLMPAFSEAWANLGSAYALTGRVDDAIAACRKAIQISPETPEPHTNLAAALKDAGLLDDALAEYRTALALAPDSLVTHSGLLYLLWFLPGFDIHAIAAEHREFSRRHALPLHSPAARVPVRVPHPNDRAPGRRLKIGYLSPDLRDHVIGRNLVPLFCHRNAAEFEVVCYSDVAVEDAFTARFRAQSDRWRAVRGLSDAAVADLVGADKVDILVDLALHMAGTRLGVFARKPAPVQVTFAGYPGTTGLTAVDYRLTDPHLDPPGMDESVYSEQTLRLPHTFWCYDPLSAEPAVSPLPADRNGHVTFGCLNNFCKVNAGVLDLWARVLCSVAGSRLMLMAPPGESRARTLAHLRDRGVTNDRVTFVDKCPRDEYLAYHHAFDIGLDTFPYNGHTTSLDALWMGVPVVTLVGTTLVGRAGLSQLRNMEMSQLAASSPDEFVEIATRLAADRTGLRQIRSGLRQQMERSPLMDSAAFAAAIEKAYRHMWQSWCAPHAP